MAKRFTETTKWDDKWFVELEPEFKLAWFYLCDCCDIAGVIDFSEMLANFRIGKTINWEAFVNATNGRVEMLEDGKLWIVGFCDFQYGELSDQCKAHSAVIRNLKKTNLFQRVSKGYPEGTGLGQGQRQGQGLNNKKEEDDWILPDGWDSQELRDALEGWAEMRKRIKKPVRSRASTSKIFKRFDSPEHLLEVAEYCEANEYQGLKPEYCKGSRSPSRESPAQRTARNALEALEDLK